MTETTPRQASQPLTLLATAMISAVVSVGGSAGFNQMNAPALEARLDRLESARDLMEYKLEELRRSRTQCRGEDQYSALVEEGVKVNLMQ